MKKHSNSETNIKLIKNIFSKNNDNSYLTLDLKSCNKNKNRVNDEKLMMDKINCIESNQNIMNKKLDLILSILSEKLLKKCDYNITHYDLCLIQMNSKEIENQKEDINEDNNIIKEELIISRQNNNDAHESLEQINDNNTEEQLNKNIEKQILDNKYNEDINNIDYENGNLNEMINDFLYQNINGKTIIKNNDESDIKTQLDNNINNNIDKEIDQFEKNENNNMVNISNDEENKDNNILEKRSI